MADLQKADMDYWALGHIHRHRVLSPANPTVVYCGNPQGRDPNEEDARGCYLVTVEAGGSIHPEFRPVDVVRWQHVAVPIDEVDTEEGLADRVTHAVDEARAAAGRSIVARVRLVGRGPMHRSLSRAEVRGSLLAVIREELGEAIPFAWVESIRDETRPLIDLEQRRQAGDFLADVLQRFETAHTALALADPPTDGSPDAATAAAEIRQELDAVLDDLYANARARRVLRDRRPPSERIAELLERAEALVVDRLADGP
jgi:DNA repair exonuclease SbcCD nuclease subunit